MRNFLIIPIIAFCLLGFNANAQQDQDQQPDQLNLPGDNLNLYAVMKLFQESPTLEEFEKKLNDPDSKVNNLDLDGDNNIDYIKVVDEVDGDIHNISLKAAVGNNEDQDVAVFVVKKDNDGQVHVQLIGDEDLYGKDYIVEPDTEAPTATPNPGYSGTPQPVVDGQPVDDVYEVSAWPVVRFIFVPSYVVWRSPWHWGYYPSYWHPWRPVFWHEYYGYQYHWNYFYRAHYRYTPVYRFPAWRDRYYGGGFRSRAPVVQVNIRAGNYRQTYSRPDLANRGSDRFRNDHPQAPSVNRRLPNFDPNNNNRPIVRHRDNNRGPGNNDNSPNRPNPRPGNPDNRPITRPGNPSPDNRPITRPGNPDPNTRPVNPNPDNRPITRPANPDPNTRPVRPTPNNPDNRPITRPIERPRESRPVTPRPDNPATRPIQPQPQPQRPITRPIERPRENRPVNPRPDNPANNRPIARPAPRPQQQPARPAQRPPGREKKDGNN